LLAARRATSSTVAYVCRGTECRAPVTRLDELTAALATAAPGGDSGGHA